MGQGLLQFPYNLPITDSPGSFTVCKGGDLPLSLYSDFKFNNKKCPEKLWITVDTIIGVYFIQT